MQLKKIHLKNFRNFSDVNFSFNNKLNFILGKNGSGKTTVLEAIHYLAFTKSFKTQYDREVIKNNNDYFQVFGDFISDKKSDRVNLNFVRSEGKRIIINERVLEKKREIIGRFPIITLSPDNEKITKGAPGERRNFIDKILSQTDRQYFEALLNFNRSLRQRNFLLRKYREKKFYQYDELLESIDDLMINDAFEISKKRILFIENFNQLFQEEIKKISHFDYNCLLKIKISASDEDENFHKNYRNKLKQKISKDVILGRTSYGPHLDNMDVYFDNREIKKVASQGEHKIALIALKMAEGKYIQTQLNSTVIYLLDDLFALLDSEHCIKTIDEISNDNQTIVTTTSLNHIEKEINNFATTDFDIIKLG